MNRESYRDRALVVRRYDLGEADRIIVLFTREHGLVRAVAKGVRRAKSRFGSRLAPFVDCDMQIYPGRNLATITGADTVRTWAAPIVDDYACYTCACAVLEVAERIIGELESPELWDLTAETLAAMAGADHAADLILTSFLLKAMTIAGWQPSLFECAGCGKAGPHHAFSPISGGAVCTNCRPPGATTPSEEALHLMWLLANDRWGVIETSISNDSGDTTADGRQLRVLAQTARNLATEHLQYHLGRKIVALELVDAYW